MQNTIHFVLQAKGGIGKCFVSTLIAQHLLTENSAVRCFDTDQENTTFVHYEALSVTHIAVANESRLIEPKRFDGLMETLLTESGTFVIDTGANTFSNLLAYMVENDVFAMLEHAGKRTYVHTIVGGGDTLADTANGFHAACGRGLKCRRLQARIIRSSRRGGLSGPHICSSKKARSYGNRLRSDKRAAHYYGDASGEKDNASQMLRIKAVFISRTALSP